MYAGEILELVQTLLEHTLECCRAIYIEAVLGSLSSSVTGRPDIANLMKQEPTNTLLDAPYLLQLGQKVTLDRPYDMEGLEVEMELNNLLLSLRPIKQVAPIEVEPDEGTYVSILNACGSAGALEWVKEGAAGTAHSEEAPAEAEAALTVDKKKLPTLGAVKSGKRLLKFGTGILKLNLW